MEVDVGEMQAHGTALGDLLDFVQIRQPYRLWWHTTTVRNILSRSSKNFVFA